MLGLLLFGLLHGVVADLAQGLEVGLIPEEKLVTTMGLDVVAYWVCFEVTTVGAGQMVTKEDLEP